MRCNTDCTIYNYYRNVSSGVEEVITTHLDGVFWESRKAVNRIKAGMTEADSMTVYIPLDVTATGSKPYIDPVKYALLSPEDARKHWTLTEGTDYIAKGITATASTSRELKEVMSGAYEHFKITSVDPKLFGSGNMRHWEVSGK